MASRWRRWDAHFATDILENKFQFIDCLDSLPVGSRGKFRFNIPPNLLVIPTITDKSDLKVGGRGRRLRDQNELKDFTKVPEPKIKEKSIQKDDYYQKLRKETQEKEWPSLASGNIVSNKKEEKPKAKQSKATVSKNTLVTSNVHLQFQDAEVEVKDIKLSSIEHDVDTSIDCDVVNTPIVPEHQQSLINEAENKEADNTILVTDGACMTNNEQSILCSPEKDDTEDEERLSTTAEENKSSPSNLELDTFCDQSFTTDEFLKSLESPEYYILVENLSMDADEVEFTELVTSFGDITSIQTQPCSDGLHKNVLVKMVDSDHCVWVISCLDGDIYGEGEERLSAKAVDDLVLAIDSK